MLALAIRYLNGWAMAAADGAKKERAEWPPHPDRVFMALSAAWFETGRDREEGEALAWLEKQGPPSVNATDASPRLSSDRRRPQIVTSYVPVNDTKLGKKVPETFVMKKLKDAGLGVLPEHRSRQPRSFPLVVPHNDTVHLIWRGIDCGEHEHALASLCRKVVYVGHSASLVQMWLDERPPSPNLVPVEGIARHRLRVFSPGRLEHLEKRCDRDNVVIHADLVAKAKTLKGKKKREIQAEIKERFGDSSPRSLRPEPGIWQGYDSPPRSVEPEPPGSVFDPRLVILTLTGRRFSVVSTLKLTEALRGALMSSCPRQPPPEWLSGHDENGKPSKKPHMALVPLPFVGSHHADGRIMGAAIVLPGDLDPKIVGPCLEPVLRDDHGVPKRIRLFNGRWFECEAELEVRETLPFNLRASTWTRPSRIWTTVTPVGFDRHFDGPDKWKLARDNVADGCERIGLPRPSEVILQPVSLAEGAPHSREFPHLRRKRDGGRIHHSHAVLVFDGDIRGPVIVGSGRYRGYGLFRPLGESGDSEWMI